jgi:hypothetical protein
MSRVSGRNYAIELATSISIITNKVHLSAANALPANQLKGYQMENSSSPHNPAAKADDKHMIDAMLKDWYPEKGVPVMRLSASTITRKAALKDHIRKVAEGGGVVLMAEERTREALYVNLASAYDFVIQYNKAESAQKALMQTALKEVVLENFPDGRYQDSKPIAQILSFVGGKDDSKVSSYVRVLTIALKSGEEAGCETDYVEPDMLAGWLRMKGGIEAVRTGKTAQNTEANRQKVVEALEDLPPEAVFDVPHWEGNVTEEDEGKLVLIVATYLGDGRFEPRAVVGGEKARNAALAQYRAANSGRFK